MTIWNLKGKKNNTEKDNKPGNLPSLHGPRVRASLPPTPEPPSNNIVNADFKQLLSLAHSTPVRASRNTASFNPVTNSQDVWTNRSVLQNNDKDLSQKYESALCIDKIETMPTLMQLPKENDKIAFKLLEMSDNYTPTISDYKIGDVMEVFSEQNRLRVKMDSCYFKSTKLGGKFEISELDSNESNIEIIIEKTFYWAEIYEPKKIV